MRSLMCRLAARSEMSRCWIMSDAMDDETADEISQNANSISGGHHREMMAGL